MATVAQVHERSLREPEKFWSEQAQRVYWHKPFDRVLDFDNPPFSRWFVGGQTNLCYNAIDRWLDSQGDNPALIWVSTEVDQERTYTRRQLLDEVQAFAAILKSQGVKKGDRVLIYMPMIPSAVFAMLACARIGAIHSVVFGGFASVNLAQRIDDARPKVIVSADAGSRAGKVTPYKPLLDKAISLCSHPPQKVIIDNRGLHDMQWVQGRDLDYAQLRLQHLGTQVPVEWMDSTDPSYI
ncbi:MAG TPA: AMP-binding protein, partial [Methylophilaceae bacterium]